MVEQGFDPGFGMRGTGTVPVSGFGGWPLGLVVATDGRATMVCLAPVQRPTDQDFKSVGNRFRKPPVSTIRIVSFPAHGRPVAVGPNADRAFVFGPDADERFVAVQAITRPNRIAVLGIIARRNRLNPTLLIFEVGAISAGIAQWRLGRTISLTRWPG